MSKNLGIFSGIAPILAGFGLMKLRGTRGIFLKAKSKMIDRGLSKQIDTALKQRQQLQAKSKMSKVPKWWNPVLGLGAFIMSGMLYS